MTDWSIVRHFKKAEFGHLPGHVSSRLIYALDELRDELGAPIVIITKDIIAPRPKTPDSLHPLGQAADVYAVGISLLDFWLYAERKSAFGGIGLYPFNFKPGLHLDVRREARRARWWRDERGVYQDFTGRSLRALAPILSLVEED